MAIEVFTQTREYDPRTDEVVRVNGSIPNDALLGGYVAEGNPFPVSPAEALEGDNDE